MVKEEGTLENRGKKGFIPDLPRYNDTISTVSFAIMNQELYDYFKNNL